MKDWLEQVEPLTLKGQIKMPYTWWAGEVGSRFLIGLRDEKTFRGTRCPICGTVYLPPKKNCGRCFIDTEEWITVADEGVVTTYTVVRFDHPVHPAKAPFAYALIRLRGADGALLHVIRDDLERLRSGVRVRAVFRVERTGSILDVDCFRIVGGEEK